MMIRASLEKRETVKQTSRQRGRSLNNNRASAFLRGLIDRGLVLIGTHHVKKKTRQMMTRPLLLNRQ